ARHRPDRYPGWHRLRLLPCLEATWVCPQFPRLYVSTSSAPAQALKELGCRIGVRGQAELDRGRLDAATCARPGLTIDFPLIEARGRQEVLQLSGRFHAEGRDRAVSGAQARCAADARREIGCRGRVVERLVPLQEHLEVRIGEEGRTVPSHR